MVITSMERIQAVELVELSANALETEIRRYVDALGGANGAAALNVRVPATARCDGKCVRVLIDAVHAADAGSETRDILALSWVPCAGCACATFSGAILLCGLEANLSYLALDGTYEYQETAGGGATSAAFARERTVHIGRALLKLLASVAQASPARASIQTSR